MSAFGGKADIAYAECPLMTQIGHGSEDHIEGALLHFIVIATPSLNILLACIRHGQLGVGPQHFDDKHRPLFALRSFEALP